MRNSKKEEVPAVDSENEEEEDAEDSGEDWKPEKKKGGAGKRKSVARTSTRQGKKSKKNETESEEEEEEDDESLEEDDGSDDASDDDGKAKKGSTKKARTSVYVGKNQPDKDGNMELYLFKNDLTSEYRKDEKLCMWRRDGASLLQKYMVVTDESKTKDIIFKASSVYSCWEEKRKNDFFQIRVQIVGEKKDGKVKVLDISEFDKFAKEDRPKIDITPKGAEGGETYNDEEDDEIDEDED